MKKRFKKNLHEVWWRVLKKIFQFVNQLTIYFLGRIYYFAQVLYNTTTYENWYMGFIIKWGRVHFS